MGRVVLVTLTNDMPPRYKTDRISGIYLFVNRINGKRYIGQSKNVYLRFYRHEGERQDDMVFHLAIAKYGWENFDWSFLERMPGATLDELNQREQYWILHYRSNEKPFGYNRVLPLDCPVKREHAMRNLERINREGLNRGTRAPLTSVTRLRMSEAKKGIKRTESEKSRLRELNLGEKNHFYGKHHSRESIEQGNRSRMLDTFYHPKPSHMAVHVKLTSSDGTTELVLIDTLSKRLHMDRKTIRKRIVANMVVQGYQLVYASPEEVTSLYEQRRLTNMITIYGTPTFW